MNNGLSLSAEGIDLIKRFEGLRLDAYRCPAGIWTIGYGHTGGIRQGDRITEQDADVLLLDDAAFAVRAVRELVDVPLRQGEFDALVSFIFNFGRTKFESSQLLKKLNADDRTGAGHEFARWIHVDGKALPGLVRRRAAEAELFLRPDPAPAGQPVSASPATGPAAQDAAAPAEPKPIWQELFEIVDQQPPAPVEERPFQSVQETKTMAPFIAAALPALIAAVPELARLFGSGSEVAQRNIQAAETVIRIAQEATGAQNAQAAAEAIQADPKAAQAVRQAVRSQWFQLAEIVEVGGGGIAGAREFAGANVHTRYGRVIEGVTYAGLGFLLLANLGVGASAMAAIWQDSPHAPALLNLGSMLVQADIGAALTALGFWLGSSVAKVRNDQTA